MVDQLTYLIAQGYELAEDEVNIKLDRFRLEYTNSDGSPK
jgi:DNA-directed RNA polymerases I, II, and III subunit RPABC1